MAKQQQNIGRFFGGGYGMAKTTTPASYAHKSLDCVKSVKFKVQCGKSLREAVQAELEAVTRVGVLLVQETGYVNPYSARKIIFLQWAERWLTT